MTARTWNLARRAAAVVLAGIVLTSAFALAAPASKSKKKSSSAKGAVPESLKVLVKVGNSTITRADVDRRLRELPEQFRANYSTPDGKRQLLDRMVEEKVWLESAVENGVADRPQVQQQLDQQRRDLLIRTWINEVMAGNAAPSDSEAQAYYDAHLSEYRTPATVTLRHIQAASEADARKVEKQLARKGSDWNAVAKKFSTDTLTRDNGGTLGTVTREGVFATLGPQPALAESAFALAAGQTGGPWRTTRGWHLVRVDERKDESVRPFDQVKPVILRTLSSQRSQEYYRLKLEEARKELGVQTDTSAVSTWMNQKRPARELFQEAQALASPQARIDAYRRLLAEHPRSDVSAQAQFMIGFVYSEELRDFDAAEIAFRDLLRDYGDSELAASAKWMIDHMRTEDAPNFAPAEGDTASSGAQGQPKGSKGLP
jgi:peptidyl-prolyl cis-trans isomerase C